MFRFIGDPKRVNMVTRFVKLEGMIDWNVKKNLEVT
jgi:hypothetical protein